MAIMAIEHDGECDFHDDTFWHALSDFEQDRAACDDTLELVTTVQAPRPMALVASSENAGKLLASATVRTHLAEWLPLSLRLSKLELIYSTSIHGRTLERFYAHTKGHKHTLTVVQVLDNDAVVGMFASQAWRISSQVYGDGECFLFRASPEPACYKWRPKSIVVHGWKKQRR